MASEKTEAQIAHNQGLRDEVQLAVQSWLTKLFQDGGRGLADYDDGTESQLVLTGARAGDGEQNETLFCVVVETRTKEVL